jgi:hypothetical protein
LDRAIVVFLKAVMNDVERQALIDDTSWFEQHPLRLTRARPAIAGEDPDVPPDAGWLAVMRKVEEGQRVRLHTFYVPRPTGDLHDIDFSAEAVAAILWLTLARPPGETIEQTSARVTAEALRTSAAEGAC